MRAVTDQLALVDMERVSLDHPKAASKLAAQFLKGGNTATVTLDGGNVRACIEERMGQTSGPWSNLINSLTLQRSRNCCDPGEQLPVEDEVLAKRLARLKAKPGDDVAQRLRIAVQKPSGRNIALAAAIRIAAAIGRGSARSCPAMLKAVPWSGAVRTMGRPSVTFTASSK